MERQTATKNKQQSINSSSLSRGILQRKCACGNQSAGGGECGECGKKNQLLQRRAVHISEPGDRYEQEADRIADQVMRMPEPTAKHQVGSEKDGVLQRKAIANSITPLQPSSTGHDQPSGVPPIVHEVLNSPSEPLDSETRMFMESRFGHDFSHVRLHVDSKAAESARAVRALAYTVGQDVVFGSGQYTSATKTRQRLLAHELVHTIQQTNAGDRLNPPPQVSIQRLTVAEKAENLKSLKYADNPRLEAAFDNSPAMALGESSDAVRLVQEGLVAAGFSLPKSTKPSGELDGIFGNETLEAVKAFQIEFAAEGLVDASGRPDGRVGRHTMSKLDELAGGSAPVPPQPQQPPGTSAQNQVVTANAARLATLRFASLTMLALQQAVNEGLNAAGIRKAFPTAVAAMDRWLKAKPEDSDFATTVQTTLSLLNQNLGPSSGIGFPPASDAICAVSPCLLRGFGCTSSTAGVNVCQGFLTINLDCQRDVLMHEFNHFIGMHKERSDRSSIAKPADAFDNADSMAEFATELAGAPTDRCSSP
jgi:peptidoglycan hydrolase-like protein with peptidoglycan-binding domain